MTDELRAMADHAMKFASNTFLETGSVDPMWIADTDEGKIIVGTQFEGDASKDAIAAYVKAKLAPKAHRLVFICEAWARILPEKGQYDGAPPSQSADRIEVIYLMAEDITGRMIMISRKIIRPEGERPHLLPEEVTESTEGNKFEGRFVGLLKRTGAIH